MSGAFLKKRATCVWLQRSFGHLLVHFTKFLMLFKFPVIREKETEDLMMSILESSIRQGRLMFFLPGLVTISLYMVLIAIGTTLLLFSYSFAIYSLLLGSEGQFGIDPFLASAGGGAAILVIFTSTCMLFIMQGKIKWVKVLRKYTLILLKVQIVGAIMILGIPSEMPLWVFIVGTIVVALCYRMICSTRVYMLASFFLAKQKLREQYTSAAK